ncbi:hypothetical protein SVA_3886 [Sulfurifustis variabilis]|uniref:Uncharacterized protein n=1 Tax=Sulfurifustis variabilis TaxID=1675686 RepID=A0A1C7AG31_9GAMM|nr:tetratricopeptide repeat protein [Sulfurifustis variabilis]BAU50420.1 hypothetical protein SVA_3886 [Sulfurifustis variabilis]
MGSLLRGPRSRWLAVFFVALIMLGVGAAAAWFGSENSSRPVFSDVWGGLSRPDGPAKGHAADKAPAALAPSLAELLPGLEAKSAAHPDDVGAQILLAQTYNELGRRADGLKVLERLAKARPNDGEIAFARADLLGHGENAAELRQSFDLYARAATLTPRLIPLARLHQGEVRARLGDRAGAIRIWEAHLARFPEDAHRALFESAIAQARAGTGG